MSLSEKTVQKVYLASSFTLAHRVESVYQALTEEGIEVPDTWWKDKTEQRRIKRMDVPDDEWYDQDVLTDRANRHFDAIQRCDAFVLVCPSQKSMKFNGANIELGYAHAYGLDCYSVGKIDRSAMYSPVVRTGSIGELVAILGSSTDPV